MSLTYQPFVSIDALVQYMTSTSPVRRLWYSFLEYVWQSYGYIISFAGAIYLAGFFRKSIRTAVSWRAVGMILVIYTGLALCHPRFRMLCKQLKFPSHHLGRVIGFFRILFTLIAGGIMRLFLGAGQLAWLFLSLLRHGQSKKVFLLKISSIIFLLLVASPHMSWWETIFVGYGLISLLFFYASRLAVWGALYSIIAASFFLVAERRGAAEMAATAAYYFLLVAVLSQVKELRNKGKCDANSYPQAE